MTEDELKNLLDKLIFPDAKKRREYKKRIQRFIKRADKLTDGKKKEMAQKYGLYPLSYLDGTFYQNILDADFSRELDQLYPEKPLGRPPELTPEVKRRLEKAKYWKEKKLTDSEIANKLTDELDEDVRVYHIRNDRRAEKKRIKKM